MLTTHDVSSFEKIQDMCVDSIHRGTLGETATEAAQNSGCIIRLHVGRKPSVSTKQVLGVFVQVLVAFYDTEVNWHFFLLFCVLYPIKCFF